MHLDPKRFSDPKKLTQAFLKADEDGSSMLETTEAARSGSECLKSTRTRGFCSDFEMESLRNLVSLQVEAWLREYLSKMGSSEEEVGGLSL